MPRLGSQISRTTKHPAKVCFASDFLPGHHKIWGGAEQVCVRLGRVLQENGHHVSIICTKPSQRMPDTLRLVPVPVMEDYLPQTAARHLRGVKTVAVPYDPISRLWSYRILSKERPDVLHLHNCSSLSLSLLVSSKRLGIPVVLSAYDYWFVCPLGFLWAIEDYHTYTGRPCTRFHGAHCYDCLVQARDFGGLNRRLMSVLLSRRKWVLNRFLGKIDAFVVLSKSNASVLEQYGIEPERVFVVPIPLSEGAETNGRIEDGSILYIGWLHPRKGLHVLLEAMPKILAQRPQSKLRVIGEAADPVYEKKILALAEAPGLCGKVEFLGRMPFEQVRALIQKANVLVIPEQWETIAPNALTEGLVHGKAIVASNIGGTKDYVTHNTNGLLADHADPADYARKIVRLLNDPALCLRLGREAKATGRRSFSKRHAYNALLKAYQAAA